MGMIDRVARYMGYERRDAFNDPSWAPLAPSVGYFATVTAHGAENLSTVLACVNAISSALAYCPVIMYRREGESRVEYPAHPLAKLVREGVNPGMTWPEFVEHILASVLLTGNALAVVDRNTQGRVIGLRYIPWQMVTVQELASGKLRYDISDGKGHSERYLTGEVIHLRDRTDDGLIGRSRLSRAAHTVESVQLANAHSRAMLANGARPSGVIEFPGTMGQPQRDDLRTQFQARHGGAGNAGSTLLLDGGMTWKAAQISPEDAELLETRKFGVIEICRLYQVPPPIVQAYENNTFTNAAQAGLWFGGFCLTHWARKIEAEFARSVLPTGGPYELELDLSGFLRGDPETRWNAHKIAIETGVLDPDEIRQIEGWNPRPEKPVEPSVDLTTPKMGATND